ncbi:hypothetical protein DFP72DRAFT_884762 [Ephemerocybe angulata]|uniref:F-box domain-containing protein n=1 Tax=Ephemerocybe angulata TaxID=980116 RepID=A0A8H6M8N1_9AGAR|nr:hypothetical protein DFP72DRAFT_884762 [Tulosesus angulatus]
MAPVCNPSEIYQQIFEWYLGPRISIRAHGDDAYNLERRQRPVLLSHVCRDWRVAALGHPYLWTDVQIHGKSELYFSFLQRSNPLPADLTIVARGKLSLIAVISILTKKFGISQEGLERVRSIHLFVYSHDQSPYVLMPIRTHKLPALRTFRVHLAAPLIPWRGRDWTGVHHHIPLLTNPTSLENVILTGICVRCAPRPEYLTTLELHRLSNTVELDLAKLQAILDLFPRLETLVIGRLTMPPNNGIPSSKPVKAPVLKSFAVASPILNPYRAPNLEGECHRLCPCLLRHLVLDNLEYLEITGEYYHALPHLSKLLAPKPVGREAEQILMLNGVDTAQHDELSEEVSWALPMAEHLLHIHLHIILQEPCSISERWLWETRGSFRSFTVYIPESQQHLIHAIPAIHRSPIRNGYIPLLLYQNGGDGSISPDSGLSPTPELDSRAPFLDAAVMKEKFGDTESGQSDLGGYFDIFGEQTDQYDTGELYDGDTDGFVDDALELEAWVRTGNT